jgi:tellurite resistance protein
MNLPSQPNQINLEPREAFLAILLVVISTDLYFDEQEYNLVKNVIKRMKLFQDCTKSQIEGMFDKLLTMIKIQKGEELLNSAISQLPVELHDSVLANATDLIIADGKITPKEKELLNNLCHSLNVDKDTLAQIIKVMMIKNK